MKILSKKTSLSSSQNPNNFVLQRITNQPGTAQVGAISKAQQIVKFLGKKNLGEK